MKRNLFGLITSYNLIARVNPRAFCRGQHEELFGLSGSGRGESGFGIGVSGFGVSGFGVGLYIYIYSHSALHTYLRTPHQKYVIHTKVCMKLS